MFDLMLSSLYKQKHCVKNVVDFTVGKSISSAK